MKIININNTKCILMVLILLAMVFYGSLNTEHIRGHAIQNECLFSNQTYTPHKLIHISHNAQFNETNGVVGGNGTKTNPYIIEGWEFSDESAEQIPFITIYDATDYFIIRNCYLHTNKSTGYMSIIIVGGVSNGTIEDNVISGLGESIYIAYSSCITILHNNISKYGTEGIYLNGVDNSSVVGNNIHGGDNGIVVDCPYWFSKGTILNNIISDNTIYSNRNWGIQVRASDGFQTNIVYNNIYNNGLGGISLNSTYEMNIQYNSINNNSGSGIKFLSQCKNVGITFNNITSNNEYGISIGPSNSGNNINHNNLIDNNHGAKQAMDNSSGNNWNAGSEGNYWSDWTTPDNDSNGIVDKPYVINGISGAKDLYPLTTLAKEKASPKPPSDIVMILSVGLLVSILIAVPVVVLWRRKRKS